MGVEWKSVKDHYVKKFSSKKLLSLFCSECDFDICGYVMVARLDKILKGDRSYNPGHTYMIVLFQKGSRIGKVKYLLDNAIYQ